MFSHDQLSSDEYLVFVELAKRVAGRASAKTERGEELTDGEIVAGILYNRFLPHVGTREVCSGFSCSCRCARNAIFPQKDAASEAATIADTLQ